MFRTILLLLLVLASPILRAEGTNAWSLPPVESLLAILPAPPETGSPAGRADLDAVEGLQARATKGELAHAEKSVKFSVFSFAEVRGEGFKAEAFPKTAAFFKKLEATVNPPKNWLKDHWHRDRPFKAHPDLVKALVTPEDGYSYPSGHAVRSWIDALVLGELDPVHRAAYLGSAWQVNVDRIIGGMHYPSDTATSRTLAEELFSDLMSDSKFKAELEELRAAEFSK